MIFYPSFHPKPGEQIFPRHKKWDKLFLQLTVVIFAARDYSKKPKKKYYEIEKDSIAHGCRSPDNWRVSGL